MNTFIVTVIKVKESSYWYKNLIGIRFEVKNKKTTVSSQPNLNFHSNNYECIRCLDLDKITNDIGIRNQIASNDFNGYYLLDDDTDAIRAIRKLKIKKVYDSQD